MYITPKDGNCSLSGRMAKIDMPQTTRRGGACGALVCLASSSWRLSDASCCLLKYFLVKDFQYPSSPSCMKCCPNFDLILVVVRSFCPTQLGPAFSDHQLIVILTCDVVLKSEPVILGTSTLASLTLVSTSFH